MSITVTRPNGTTISPYDWEDDATFLNRMLTFAKRVRETFEVSDGSTIDGVAALVAEWEETSYIGPEGEIRWKANDSVPPGDLGDEMVEFGMITSETAEVSEKVRRIETARMIEKYRAERRAMSDEMKAEERLNMLAAVGPGVEMVDVITGETIRT